MFERAETGAIEASDIGAAILWLTNIGVVQQDNNNFEAAKSAYLRALALAQQINSKREIVNTLEDMAHVSIAAGKLDEASEYLRRLEPLVQASGNRLDALDVMLARGKIAAARGDFGGAEGLFRAVDVDGAAQTSMRMGAEHQLARLYEAAGRGRDAEGMFQTALATFEGARGQLKAEDSKLPFLANAAPIYDDYVDFLVDAGRADEALLLADRSRARTLAQGLGEDVGKHTSGAKAADSSGPRIVKAEALTYQPHPFKIPEGLSARAVARKAGATLLFYWLGERKSFVWVVTPAACQMVALPGRATIAPLVERYGRLLQGVGDPLLEGGAANATGRALYEMLVSAVAGKIQVGKPVMILADGALSTLNFETLVAPGVAPGAIGESKAGHYWIEDVTLMSAPSLAMLAAARPASGVNGRMLLVGDAVSAGADYPELPYAAGEMREVETHFAKSGFGRQKGLLPVVFRRESATPAAYLASEPGRFGYIHFVSHGVASRTDPLDSAIILSRGGTGASSAKAGDDAGFKLYAREVMRHPIDARLVTISACYGSGTRAYAGEGLVGLSWAFLRAGAHNTIGALWEATDASTPRLMGDLYAGLGAGLEPGEALRQAKLGLLHSGGKFRKPFYWAPFQIYTRL